MVEGALALLQERLEQRVLRQEPPAAAAAAGGAA
jgi:hypothetical protein